jgi:hypothetical protein
MRLKRKSSGHYIFGEFEIILDAPQAGVSVGTGCAASRWNVYKRGCDEPEDRFVTLSEIRLWLATAQQAGAADPLPAVDDGNNSNSAGS